MKRPEQIITVLPARASHVARLTPHVREVDRSELWHGWRQTPEEAMHEGVRASSHAWTAFVEMEPICMLGIVPVSILGGVGVPWLIGTLALEQHQVAFLRRCRPHFTRMKALYVELSNHVAADNDAAVRWLTWLGFTVQPAIQFGPDNALFHPFEWKAIACVVQQQSR